MKNIFLILTALIISILTNKIVVGQKLIIELAESNVFVQRDNLVLAKKEALKKAKTKVILQAVSRFIDYNNMVALEPILLKHFLELPDAYIESIRVINEGNTNDLTEFNIKIEAQIFRSRLLSAFRNQGIPTQVEKIGSRKIYLIYNANNSFRKKVVSHKFLKNLQIRLNPYKIKMKVLDIKDKNPPIEDGIKSRLQFLPKNITKNNKGNNLALLELKLRLTPEKNNSQEKSVEAELIFWSQNKVIEEFSKNLTKAYTKISFKVWNKNEIVTKILDKLMLQWTPIILKTINFSKGSGKKVYLKFQGLTGPIHEQLLFKTLFQNNPRWEKINLDVISNNYVSYKGYFLGNKKEILSELRLIKDSQFYIKNSFWEKNILTVELIWKEIVTKLEKYKFTEKENKLLDENFTTADAIIPILQVPLRKFKQTYSLPLRTPVYDHIRHRGDSTLFKVEEDLIKNINEQNKLVKIFWQRFGPTNLKPKITLFDENKKHIKTYDLGKRKHFFFEHKLINDKKALYLRISDELGFLEDVAGSYQSFRYVLSIN